MTDRGDAEVAQIVACQRPQHLAIDVVVAECRGIDRKAQVFEPVFHVEWQRRSHADFFADAR